MDELRAWTRRLLSFFGRPVGPRAPKPKGEGPYRAPGERSRDDESAPPPAPAPPGRRYAPFVAPALVAGLLGVFAATRPANEAPAVAAAEEDTAPSLLVDAEAPPVLAPAPPPCTDAELRTFIDEGKKAIAKRKYEDARTALDKALVCRPDDAEALSERGLAWFLSGEISNANEDLALASRKTKKPGLLGTIWYRRGLVDEKELGENSGEPAYVTSYWLGHHEGAKKKVGSNACGSTSSRFHAGAMGDVTQTDTSLDKLVASLGPDDAERTGLGPDGTGLLEVVAGGMSDNWLVAKGKTAAWAFRLASPQQVYHCRGMSTFALSKEGAIVHAHGHVADPRVQDLDDGHGVVQHGCFLGSVTAVDAFFRPDREMAIVVRRDLPGRFDERDDVPAPKVTLTASGVTIKGLGCNDAETWDDVADGGAGEGGEGGAGEVGDGGELRDGGDGASGERKP